MSPVVRRFTVTAAGAVQLGWDSPRVPPYGSRMAATAKAAVHACAVGRAKQYVRVHARFRLWPSCPQPWASMPTGPRVWLSNSTASTPSSRARHTRVRSASRLARAGRKRGARIVARGTHRTRALVPLELWERSAGVWGVEDPLEIGAADLVEVREDRVQLALEAVPSGLGPSPSTQAPSNTPKFPVPPTPRGQSVTPYSSEESAGATRVNLMGG